ncbi:VCBS repeat protein [Flavobacteriaceae bacterium MAR_2009_75]|nr:VCBS repeat protein [Flavobacteriaceae bacterium MAR_2009_75]
MLFRFSSFLIFLCWLFISCNDNASKKQQPSDLKESSESKPSGERLARTYCASCHIFPEPELLAKGTWQFGVLPQMAYRMGIYNDITREGLIESNGGGLLVEESNIFPRQQLVNNQEWEAIKQYYIEKAPDSVVQLQKELNESNSDFRVSSPDFRISPPMITAIKFNAELNQVYVADTKQDYSTLNILSKELKSLSTLALPSAISNITHKSDTIFATLMGSFTPSDNPNGSLVKIFKRPGDEDYKGFSSVLKNLQRPVQSIFEDLNGDGLEDIVVCEYGNHTGKLSLFLKRKDRGYDKRILSYDPGAAAVNIVDLNNDGLNDIIVLMGQGKERIDAYYNEGDGEFRLKNLLRFPAVYGSVSFSMVDWNKDGHADIMYVNGDNADYSRFPKPYHGLRIYINDGDDNFKEAFFQHQNGAYKAVPYDFDKDGDLDIALASFFPDLIEAPQEGFIYMENKTVNDSIAFRLSTFAGSGSGRWLVMEPTDVDQNNFPELLLGSFTGMAINGDKDGKAASHFARNSPTLVLLKFD